MDNLSGCVHLHDLHVQGLEPQVIEQLDTVKEQNGHQVDVDFVQESSLKALLHDTGSAHRNRLLASNLLCYFYRAGHAVGYEREGRSGLDPFLRDPMGQNDDRHVHRVLAAPGLGDVKRPARRHQRAGRLASGLDYIGAVLGHLEHTVAARDLTRGIAAEIPFEESLPASLPRSALAMGI